MGLNCTLLKSDILDGLGSLQNVTNKRGTIAILSNILIESTNNSLILTGTDLEVGIRLTVEAQVHEQGSITLPSKKLFEIVRESGSNSIKLREKENNWVEIVSGKSTYNLAGMTSSDFPEFPVFDEDKLVELESFNVLELIDKTIHSVAGDQENIYSLTSVLFEKEVKDATHYIRMISSDGHRLSIMEKDVAFDTDQLNLNEVTLVPKKGVQELRKFCERKDTIQISFEEKQMVVTDKDEVMVIRLRQGEFPKYNAIVDAVKFENPIEIDRVPFLESLKRINLFTEDLFHTIHLRIENNMMVLSSQNADIGNAKDEQGVSYNGEPLSLGFNCRYFIETLQVMDCEKLNAYINSNESPCLIQSPDDPGFVSIIMPMQL